MVCGRSPQTAAARCRRQLRAPAHLFQSVESGGHGVHPRLQRGIPIFCWGRVGGWVDGETGGGIPHRTTVLCWGGRMGRDVAGVAAGRGASSGAAPRLLATEEPGSPSSLPGRLHPSRGPVLKELAAGRQQAAPACPPHQCWPTGPTGLLAAPTNLIAVLLQNRLHRVGKWAAKWAAAVVEAAGELQAGRRGAAGGGGGGGVCRASKACPPAATAPAAGHAARRPAAGALMSAHQRSVCACVPACQPCTRQRLPAPSPAASRTWCLLCTRRC